MKFRHMLLLAMLLLFVPACGQKPPPSTPDPTATLLAEILHFENEIVAFDYYAGTQIFSLADGGFTPYSSYLPYGGELEAGLADPLWSYQEVLYSSIGIFRHALPAGSSLEEVMAAVYARAFSGQPVPEEVAALNGPLDVNGLPAIRKTQQVASGPKWYTLQDIWIEKDGTVFRLSLWEEVYEERYQEAADLLLSTFEIKDDLPPFSEQPTPEPTLTPTPYPPALLAHFDNEFLSFDYPRAMKILPPGDPNAGCFPDMPFGGERLAGLGDERFLTNDIYYRSIQVMRRSLPAGSNLEAVLLEVYAQAEANYPQDPATLFSTGPVSVAGLQGIQWAYRVTAGEPVYEMRDLWLEGNDELYIISIWSEWTNAQDFWEFQSGAQALLDSLVIK